MADDAGAGQLVCDSDAVLEGGRGVRFAVSDNATTDG